MVLPIRFTRPGKFSKKKQNVFSFSLRFDIKMHTICVVLIHALVQYSIGKDAIRVN